MNVATIDDYSPNADVVNLDLSHRVAAYLYFKTAYRAPKLVAGLVAALRYLEVHPDASIDALVTEANSTTSPYSDPLITSADIQDAITWLENGAYLSTWLGVDPITGEPI